MSSEDVKFADECLAAINKYRLHHQVEPLVYSHEIEKIAKNWVEQMTQKNVFGHNPDRSYKGGKLGENIASRWSSSPSGITGTQIAHQWYKEAKDYDFEAKRGGGGTDHFTQVVWKDSKELGIARGQTKDGTWMIVANFFPPGNFNNDYANNVFPPKDGKICFPTNNDDHKHQHADSQHPTKVLSTSTKKQTSTVNDVETTIETETTIHEGGVKKVKVTEKVKRPGSAPEVKVTVTTTNPDGSTSEETLRDDEKNGPTARDSQQPARVLSTSTEQQTSTVNDVKTTITKETTLLEDGVKKVKVTEKVNSPGSAPKVKVTVTTTNPDGSTSEETLIGEEKSAPTKTLHPPATSNKTSTGNDFCRDVVNTHNKLRQRHRDTEDLVLNDKLMALAQSWADHLAKTKILQHSDLTYKGQPLGENVAEKQGTGHVDYTGEEVVSYWYKEIEKYDYRNPSGTGTGHFTQVVWKDSKEIGVGKAFSTDNQVYVVALYYPAGNYVGRENYETNVKPLKHD